MTVHGVCRLLAGSALLFTVACQQPGSEDRPEQHAAGAGHDAEHRVEAHASDHGAEGHEAMLLRTIMQQLSVDLAGFSHALWLEDGAAMTARAGAIADHAHMTPDEVQRIRTELGPEMDEFEAEDDAVHQSAIRLHAAAEAGHMEEVLQELNRIQRGCVSCHTRFRERLRTYGP
jgi:cytochrome c556